LDQALPDAADLPATLIADEHRHWMPVIFLNTTMVVSCQLRAAAASSWAGAAKAEPERPWPEPWAVVPTATASPRKS
jgi:hypothetical protein